MDDRESQRREQFQKVLDYHLCHALRAIGQSVVDMHNGRVTERRKDGKATYWFLGTPILETWWEVTEDPPTEHLGPVLNETLHFNHLVADPPPAPRID